MLTDYLTDYTIETSNILAYEKLYRRQIPTDFEEIDIKLYEALECELKNHFENDTFKTPPEQIIGQDQLMFDTILSMGFAKKLTKTTYKEFLLINSQKIYFSSTSYVRNKSKNFNTFFAYKLRQYQTDLSLLNGFLDYHFDKSFSLNIDSMKKSITTIFNDFNIIIDSAVKKGTEEYLAKQVPKTEMSVSIEDSHQKAPTPIVQRRSVIETKEEFAHENSFCLKVFSNKIKSRSDLRIPCDNLVDELKTLKLISGEKCTTQLLDILCGKPLSTITDKLNWVGSYKNLNVFINEIVKRENLIKYVGRDHWTITIECFLKNGGPIDRVKLKKPDSKTYPMEKNIKELIDDFEQKITSPRTSDN